MATDPTAELTRFHQFISSHLERGDALSPEEALDLWRTENPTAEEMRDSVKAIAEALADMEAGDAGVPIEEFDRAFRARHGLPST